MQNYMSWLDSQVCTLPAQAPQAPLSRILATLKIWYDRRQGRRALSRLDARLLADIGRDAHSAAQEAAKPFWEQ